MLIEICHHILLNYAQAQKMKTCILAYFYVVIIAYEGKWWWLLNHIGLVLHNQALGTPHFIIVPMTTGYNTACTLHPSLVSVPFCAIPISLSKIYIFKFTSVIDNVHLKFNT